MECLVAWWTRDTFCASVCVRVGGWVSHRIHHEHGSCFGFFLFGCGEIAGRWVRECLELFGLEVPPSKGPQAAVHSSTSTAADASAHAAVVDACVELRASSRAAALESHDKETKKRLLQACDKARDALRTPFFNLLFLSLSLLWFVSRAAVCIPASANTHDAT